jgi:hypothetical protein
MHRDEQGVKLADNLRDASFADWDLDEVAPVGHKIRV